LYDGSHHSGAWRVGKPLLCRIQNNLAMRRQNGGFKKRVGIF